MNPDVLAAVLMSGAFISWLMILGIVIGVNVVPLIMPPTWVVLAFFHLRWDVPVLPLAIVGALGATTGRGLLALLSRAFGLRFIPRRWQQNIETLVEGIRNHRGASWVSMGLFALGPVPTDHLFIAAGIARAPLPPLLAIFGVSRFVSYLLWVSVAKTTTDSIGKLLRPSFGGGIALAAQILGFVLLIVMMQVDWARILRSRGRRNDEPTPRAEQPKPTRD